MVRPMQLYYFQLKYGAFSFVSISHCNRKSNIERDDISSVTFVTAKLHHLFHCTWKKPANSFIYNGHFSHSILNARCICVLFVSWRQQQRTTNNSIFSLSVMFFFSKFACVNCIFSVHMIWIISFFFFVVLLIFLHWLHSAYQFGMHAIVFVGGSDW